MYFNRLLLVGLSISISVTWCQDTRSFKQFLDTRVNPCENFYQYACGKWTPTNVNAVDVITDQKLENRNALKQHFTSLRRRNIRDNPASEFYHLCVSSKHQSEEDILQPYLTALVAISDWPYVNQTFEASSFDWLQVAANLRRHQVDTFFKLSIQHSWKDSTQHIIYLTASRKQFDGPSDGDGAFMYKTYIKYILLGFGVRVRKANLFAQEVVDFEVELDMLNRDVKDELIDPISIDELIRQVPGIKWMQYFNTLLGEPAKRSQLQVVQVDLFRKLEVLLQRTNTETIALFQLTRFLRHYDVKMDAPDWINCMDEVNAMMPLLVSRNFLALRQSFTSSKVREVFENVREEFLLQVNETNWYDTNSKREIRSKLESIGILIGYPEEELRSQSKIQIDLQSYQKSRLLLEQLAAKNELNLLTYPSVAANGNLKPLNVNAYYKLTTNALEIPIGILQPPMYREDSNMAQIMGSLGTIIAHELVHGFDYDGQNYDSKGNVITESNPKVIIQFGLRANCFIDQYSGLRVSALNEDIADNEGLRLSYGAYERLKKERPFTDSTISGEQLFFISFAQVWCGSDAHTSRLRNHSPHRDRVNNVLANSPEFSEAFSCPKGSTLNPVKKCQIW